MAMHTGSVQDDAGHASDEVGSNRSEAMKHPPTPCCGHITFEALPYPIRWNPSLGVIQCHKCGEIYIPATVALRVAKDAQEQVMKFVSKECQKQTDRLFSLRIQEKLKS